MASDTGVKGSYINLYKAHALVTKILESFTKELKNTTNNFRIFDNYRLFLFLLLSVCLFVCCSFIRSFVRLFVRLFVYLCICLFVCLLAFLFVCCVFVCLFNFLLSILICVSLHRKRGFTISEAYL